MKYYLPISCFFLFSSGCSIYNKYSFQENYSTSWSSAIEKKSNQNSTFQTLEATPLTKKLSIAELEQLAYDGDSSIQFELAHRYIEKNADHYNVQQAFFWCEQSAEAGHPSATFMMSYLYREGLGAEKNRKLSLKWLKQAAKLKVTEAQYLLGYAYENQKGVKRNYSRAIGLYRLASEKKHQGAQHALAKMYYTGQATGVDYHKAIDLFIQSAYAGNRSSQYYLGAMYYNEQHRNIAFIDLPSDYQDLLRKTNLDANNHDTKNQLAYIWFSLANESNNETAVQMMEIIEPNIDLVKTHKILAVWKQELQM